MVVSEAGAVWDDANAALLSSIREKIHSKIWESQCLSFPRTMWPVSLTAWVAMPWSGAWTACTRRLFLYIWVLSRHICDIFHTVGKFAYGFCQVCNCLQSPNALLIRPWSWVASDLTTLPCSTMSCDVSTTGDPDSNVRQVTGEWRIWLTYHLS